MTSVPGSSVAIYYPIAANYAGKSLEGQSVTLAFASSIGDGSDVAASQSMDATSIRLIGIDCATQPKKTGLALGHLDEGVPTIEDAKCCSTAADVRDAICSWIRPKGTLIAMDAPLGWPSRLGPSLSSHEAGDFLADQPSMLFSRETDRFVREKFGKMPFEVGADRIARTAHAALTLLRDLRLATGQPIPLAWDPNDIPGVAVIEVYPAATLMAHGFRKGNTSVESFMATLLKQQFQGELLQNEHVRDAILCVLAGADFLSGRARSPTNIDLAKKEGWIWV